MLPREIIPLHGNSSLLVLNYQRALSVQPRSDAELILSLRALINSNLRGSKS